MTEPDIKAIAAQIQKGDKGAFKILFETYYAILCAYAFQFVKNNETAEEMVQSVFVKLWEKHHSLEIETSLKHYLYRSVRNQSLNYIQHKKIQDHFVKKSYEEQTRNYVPRENFPDPGLMKKIEASINSLPEKRRNIFRLNREEGLKYKEIAQKLNISIKTVENQMGAALRTLREKLKDYNQFFVLFLIFLK